jgi:hypothetical protein
MVFYAPIENRDQQGIDGMMAKRRGRPTKKPTQARVSLGLRVTADIKQRLDGAAVASGRSQSQEAETRIGRSFADEDVITAALGGAELRDLALMMVATFAHGGKAAAASEGKSIKASDWLRDQESYRAAVTDVAAMLIERMPVPTIEEKMFALEDLKRRLMAGLTRTGELKFDFGDGPQGSGFLP